jgi:two-component system, NarL family, invasion response regulator UvrY
MINVIIADDHSIVRAGLKQILSEYPDINTADEASNGQDLLDKVRRSTYDVILLDISMPDRSGLEILKQLRMERMNTPVLVLSIHPEEHYAIRALKAGASGYLNKETASEQLVEAIKKVYNGGKYISPKLAEKLADELVSNTDRSPHEILTDREYQVFCRIASGKTVSDIAAELFLSVKTISTYRRRILEKINMKNNSELTYYAIKNNLLD